VSAEAGLGAVMVMALLEGAGIGASPRWENFRTKPDDPSGSAPNQSRDVRR
jgi:hypothetical protein